MKKQRPVNLDLQTIRFPVTAIASILHRVSGVITFVAVGILLWLLGMSLSSPEGFAHAAEIMNGFIVKFIFWGILTALAYHVCGGIRHLLMARGKALLTHFSNGLTLYSHNQLYGVWRVVEAGHEPKESKRSLRVKLQSTDGTILLYSASEIEMWASDEIENHPFLQRIGPDVLDETLTVEQVRERLVSTQFRNRQLGGMLLDQAFLAGLGNYLRAEILWQAKLLPEHKPKDLNDQQLDDLADACLSIARLSYATRGQVQENKHHGALFSFRVFGRAGKVCKRCGEILVKTSVSTRPFFYCPGCQH